MNLEIGVIEEFGVTDCTQHLRKYLAFMDWVFWVVDFGDVFFAIFVALGLVKAFGLRLISVQGRWGYFESNFIV